MATPQLSPGVLVREVDLTVGRADNVLDNIGAIAGPFPIGPVEEAVDITTEQDLINFDIYPNPIIDNKLFITSKGDLDATFQIIIKDLLDCYIITVLEPKKLNIVCVKLYICI